MNTKILLPVMLFLSGIYNHCLGSINSNYYNLQEQNQPRRCCGIVCNQDRICRGIVLCASLVAAAEIATAVINSPSIHNPSLNTTTIISPSPTFMTRDNSTSIYEHVDLKPSDKSLDKVRSLLRRKK
jgi:hypothetical protein